MRPSLRRNSAFRRLDATAFLSAGQPSRRAFFALLNPASRASIRRASSEDSIMMIF